MASAGGRGGRAHHGLEHTTAHRTSAGCQTGHVPTHAPAGYDCPFCRLVAGEDGDVNRQEDVVYQGNETTAFIAPKWWEGNPGHVLVVPDPHHENIYDIPREVLGAVYETAQLVARAVRASYGCEGTSTRQHNEPGAGQDVWHFHVHVFPRYAGDDLYANDARVRWASADERAPYAERLRASLGS
jgi:histidine triad (HIT) family protein